MNIVPVSVIIPAWRRVDQTLVTLGKISECSPAPSEILVHIDAGGDLCAQAIAAEFPQVRLILSDVNVGPGGGRNRLMSSACNELVVSLDDDSYPLDLDFFGRVISVASEHPEYAVYTARIFERGDSLQAAPLPPSEKCSFIGCGAVLRRSTFALTNGYVPLPVAYGMEEVDISMQLHGLGERIISAPELNIFHDTELEHHGSASITSATIANQALLMWLRYPISFWPRGTGQIFSRILWLIKNQRFSGIVSGLVKIPGHCWRHKSHRKTLSKDSLYSYFKLRKACSSNANS